jgi:HEAT repeat protein
MEDPVSKPEQKMRALKAMADQGVDESVGIMGIGLNDKAPQVRMASVRALGVLASEEVIPHLIRATQDKDTKVRCRAIKELSGFPGDDRVEAALRKATDDADENVRKEAADSFRSLGQPTETGIAILRDLKSHKDPYVADKADSILKYWGLEK